MPTGSGTSKYQSSTSRLKPLEKIGGGPLGNLASMSNKQTLTSKMRSPDSINNTHHGGNSIGVDNNYSSPLDNNGNSNKGPGMGAHSVTNQAANSLNANS